MKRILFAVALIGLASCGYDGHYRYECQDPENWKNEECNPPLCNVDGMCTETLIGFDPFAEEPDVPTGEPAVTPEPETEETIAP